METGQKRAARAQPVRHVRRGSRVIGNCDGDGEGDGGGGVANDVVLASTKRRTPDHPPYSEMVSVALRSLAEENGSTEYSISAYIKSNFDDLPWGHDRLLPYYLRKLVADGELTSPFPDRYQLPFQSPPSVSLPVRRRGRPRLYPANPKPSVCPRPSSPPRHRGRSSLRRRRGRPPKIHAEEMAPLKVKQGTSPPRRGRGRIRLQRGDSIGRASTRRPGLRIPRSRGSKRRRDDILVSDAEEMNCLSGNPAFLDDFMNRDSEQHFELEQYAQLELGHPFVAPEQSELREGQFLGEESPLLILDPGKMTLLLGPEHREHDEGLPLQGEEQPILAPEKTEVGHDPSLLGEKLPLLTPEQGKMPPFLAPELSEHAQGQSMQEDAHPFAASEQTELGKDQSSPEQAKVPPCLSPEFSEPDQGQPQQGESQPFMPHDQTELVQKKSTETNPLLSPEQTELDHGLPSVAVEESEEGHEQMIQGIGTAEPKEGELVQTPRPDEEEEVENAVVSNKKRKSHGKRRSMRLWFES